MDISALNFKDFQRGSLLGFFDLRYHGMIIKGCRLMQGEHGFWFSFPQREGAGENGEKAYFDQVYVTAPERDHIRRLVLLDLQQQGHIGGAVPANGAAPTKRPATQRQGSGSFRTPEGEDLSEHYTQADDDIPY